MESVDCAGDRPGVCRTHPACYSWRKAELSHHIQPGEISPFALDHSADRSDPSAGGAVYPVRDLGSLYLFPPAPAAGCPGHAGAYGALRTALSGAFFPGRRTAFGAAPAGADSAHAVFGDFRYFHRNGNPGFFRLLYDEKGISPAHLCGGDRPVLSALHSLDLFQRAVYPEPVQLSQCQSRQRRAGTWTFLENVFLRAVVELLLFCSAAGIFMPYHAGRADGDSRDGKQQCHHIPGDAHFETADTAGAVELFVLRNAHLHGASDGTAGKALRPAAGGSPAGTPFL